MKTCVMCGKDTAQEVTSRRTVYLLGHEEAFERKQFDCTSCGRKFTNDEQGLGNERAEQAAIARALAEIGPNELRSLRELVDLTQPELENAFGIGRNTIARWETGAREIPPYIKNMVRLAALHPASLLLLRDQDLPMADRTELSAVQPVKTKSRGIGDYRHISDSNFGDVVDDSHLGDSNAVIHARFGKKRRRYTESASTAVAGKKGQRRGQKARRHVEQQIHFFPVAQ